MPSKKITKPRPAVAVPAKPRAKRVANTSTGHRYAMAKDGAITRLADGAHIPQDPANGDFAAFIAAVEADPSIVLH